MWNANTHSTITDPWNKGKLIGQKLPLTQQEIWSIRLQLTVAGRSRDLALFNLAIDSKLRACDLLKLRLSDVAKGSEINSRAAIVQQKTGRPVRFELTTKTRASIASWVKEGELKPSSFLFPSRIRRSSHLSTRQNARIVDGWVTEIGLDRSKYGTHSTRRTKATPIYRRTKNLRAVQLLLGHSMLDSTVRYLGIEMDDALDLSERLDV